MGNLNRWARHGNISSRDQNVLASTFTADCDTGCGASGSRRFDRWAPNLDQTARAYGHKVLGDTTVACVKSFNSDRRLCPIHVSIVDGETILLRNVSTTTSGCEPLFQEFEALDTLEGSPELTLKAEAGMVSVNSTKGRCIDLVPGVKVTVTASNVTEKKEVALTWRARYKTKNAGSAGTCSSLTSRQ